MIIIKLMGGLGNQLQQYALYQKLISLGRECYLDLSWFDADVQKNMAAQRECELKLFSNADFREASDKQVYSLIGNGSLSSKIAKKLAGIISDNPWENHKRRSVLGIKGNGYFAESRMFHDNLFDMDDVYLEGYWAAEKYYADILPVLRNKLFFDESEMDEANLAMAAKIREVSGGKEETDKFSCAVHIRRGDYLDPINLSMFGNIATEEYYNAAFETIRRSFPGTHFFVFSDDVAYVQEHYGTDESCTIVDINHGMNSRFDIYLMSLCDMHICANSTFSFWGARLSTEHCRVVGQTTESASYEKTNVMPINIRPTIQKNSQTFDAAVMRNLWKGWTFIDPDGVLR